MSTPPDDPRLALAHAAGAIYPDLIAAQIPEGADPAAIDTAIRELRTTYPDAFARSGGADGGAGRGTPTPARNDLNSVIRRLFERGR